MSCNSVIQALVATRTNSVPSGVTLSGAVTAAICAPTRCGQSGITWAWASRLPRPLFAR